MTEWETGYVVLIVGKRGRWKKVVKGQSLLGIVLTINGKVWPLHLLFCAKQGCQNTDKPSLLVSMLTRLKEEFAKQDIDITTIPLTMDSRGCFRATQTTITATGI
ncbi:MAG: hypothetical protein QNJ41_16895 [Xenococcaceae cyanobacterium MO_188.B32]|nr:hypothetical protein [Xenococcaceae cyanobacterium MO_188.B32]